jgi:hypothetical protein
MNYGHALEFGTFITPSNTDPQATVALAETSERLGYDLVTFQDHPYVADHLDTWTLLSWVAGKTERIRIAANVHSLPLRPPAMLARSAASLDLLSNGRFTLGLGAGAFWDGIAAMGGERKAPGEAVDALTEATTVIRELWNAGERRLFRFDGDHYRVPRAQRGPLPAHDIPLMLGAYKPRMLQLVGREADAWSATHSYLHPGDLANANAIIDEAATEAGRDPREIRRVLTIKGTFTDERDGVLTGPPEAWVDDLLPLVLDDGIGTFLLWADDEATMTRFATEVVPALRAAALRALPELETGVTVRPAAARAKRREGIDYDGIPASLKPAAVEPGDMAYAKVKDTYMRGGSPGLVFNVTTTEQVADALAFAREHEGVPMGVRSGGHGISGRSTNDGGIVINLAGLDGMEMMDEERNLVRIGPGARWMDVAAFLHPHNLAITSGDYGGVGVGGLATAGGIGFIARDHGLTLDHIRAAEVVLADGSVVRASEEEHADLFWAIRGAGANFGIVTSFEFEAKPVGNVGWATLIFDATDLAGFLQKWGEVLEASPRDVSGEIILGSPRRDQPMIAQALVMVNSHDPDTVVSRLQSIANIAPLYQPQIVMAPYVSVISNAADTGYHKGRGEPVSHNGFVEHITPDVARAAAQLLWNGATYFFQVRSVGGAVSDVAPDAMAYAHRSANFNIAAMGASRQRIDPVWDGLRPHLDGLYLSFETDRGVERLHDAFPPDTLRRLRELKQKYDPDNVFRDNFNIAPMAAVR